MAFPGKGFSKNTNNKNFGGKVDEARLNQMVKDRAYYLWLEKGKPRGQDTNIWLQAEKEIITKIKK